LADDVRPKFADRVEGVHRVDGLPESAQNNGASDENKTADKNEQAGHEKYK
jgi:hypothetical protein